MRSFCLTIWLTLLHLFLLVFHSYVAHAPAIMISKKLNSKLGNCLLVQIRAESTGLSICYLGLGKTWGCPCVAIREYLLLLLGSYCFCPLFCPFCMKCSLGITNFLEDISSLSHSIVSLYFFALFT